MAAERITPVDEKTGIPLPIISGEDIHRLFGTEDVNRNHAFHPKLDPRLQTAGGLALRVCRIQTVEAIYHNVGTHSYHTFFDGPPIPETEAEQFKTCVYAVAGFMPEKGIDLSTGEPVVRPMTKHELDRLKTISCGDYRYFKFGEGAIRLFMRDVILNKTAEVESSRLEKFLTTKDVHQRRRAGLHILRRASVIAAEEVSSEFNEVHREGYLHPDTPAKPHPIVLDILRNPRKVELHMFDRLKQMAELALDNAA